MDQMNDDFKNAVRAAVEERIGERVLLEHVRKNNGLMLTGLVVRGNSNTAPTFYLENIRPEKRTLDRVDHIADEIVEFLQANQSSSGISNAAEVMNRILGDMDELKGRVYPRVVNYAWNEDLLQTLPHRRSLTSP